MGLLHVKLENVKLVPTPVAIITRSRVSRFIPISDDHREYPHLVIVNVDFSPNDMFSTPSSQPGKISFRQGCSY